MVDEQHYDDDALFALLCEDGGDEDHLGACTGCREKLDAYRLVANALREEATWDERPLDETPNPHTIATLRNFADQMAAEDLDAALYLQDLLEGPRETWMDNLRQHPEFRTAGVVRKLIEAAPAALDAMPRDAVELTALATEIADHLDPCIDTTDTVSRLRGAAWRERAYALFYTGDFANAERALCASESHFTESCVNEYDLARVGIVRALVERSTERYGTAIASARRSAGTFSRFEDLSRTASARLAEVHLLYSAGDFKAAFAILSGLATMLQSSEDSDTYARVLCNLGYCCWKLGKIDDALQHHDAAAALLDDLEICAESNRMRWTVASMLAGEGRVDEAIRRLQGVQREFERLGMANLVALVGLEIAELHLARGEYALVEAICRAAMRSFEASGVAHTARALTALAFMHEAAQKRTATPVLVRHVRKYLERLPASENLLFVPLFD